MKSAKQLVAAAAGAVLSLDWQCRWPKPPVGRAHTHRQHARNSQARSRAPRSSTR